MKYYEKMAVAVICSTLLFGFGNYVYGQEKQEGAAEAQKTPAKVEETTPVTGVATMGVFSKYVFRGYELSKNSVVFQPGLTATLGGFSAGFWGNIDSSQNRTQSFVENDHHKSFNETDITLSYTKAFGKLSLTGGYIYYGTKYADETEEVFGTVAYDMIGKPTLSIYRDLNQYVGTYINFSLAHSIPLVCDITLDLGASAGYMIGDSDYWKTNTASGDQIGSKYKAFHDGKLQAGLTIPVTKKVSVVPVLQYWFPLSDKAKRHWGYGKDAVSYNPNGYLKSFFAGGVNVNYSF